MKKILIFASGSGSNAQNIALYCRENNFANVVAIGTNNPSAKVLEKAKNLSIATFVFTKKMLFGDEVLQIVNDFSPDLIVLAGFLLQFPSHIIEKYPNKIINIHPALLPKFGGKGMYGRHVHEAVLANNEIETGITIHFVNDNYDEGAIIFQKKVSIKNCVSIDEIASKIHDLEMDCFPKIIEKLLTEK